MARTPEGVGNSNNWLEPTDHPHLAVDALLAGDDGLKLRLKTVKQLEAGKYEYCLGEIVKAASGALKRAGAGTHATCPDRRDSTARKRLMTEAIANVAEELQHAPAEAAATVRPAACCAHTLYGIAFCLLPSAIQL